MIQVDNDDIRRITPLGKAERILAKVPPEVLDRVVGAGVARGKGPAHAQVYQVVSVAGVLQSRAASETIRLEGRREKG